MQVNQAIIAFSQSEKLKSGIIWANQIIEMYIALSESEKPGAERVLKTLINMIAAGEAGGRRLFRPVDE